MGERRPHRAETPDVEVRGDESQTNTLYSPPWKTIDVFFFAFRSVGERTRSINL